ncbi:MAG: hypothetical protein ACLVJ6_00205 [Merdibacter sp.]
MTGCICFSIDERAYYAAAGGEAAAGGYAFLARTSCAPCVIGSLRWRPSAASTVELVSDAPVLRQLWPQHACMKKSACCGVIIPGEHGDPKIVPAVIVGVIHEDEIVLTRYAGSYRKDALIAGL